MSKKAKRTLTCSEDRTGSLPSLTHCCILHGPTLHTSGTVAMTHPSHSPVHHITCIPMSTSELLLIFGFFCPFEPFLPCASSWRSGLRVFSSLETLSREEKRFAFSVLFRLSLLLACELTPRHLCLYCTTPAFEFSFWHWCRVLVLRRLCRLPAPQRQYRVLASRRWCQRPVPRRRHRFLVSSSSYARCRFFCAGV